MVVPDSISWLLAATDALLILAGIVGGGFGVKEVKMPKLSGPVGILALVFGIALVGLATVEQLEYGAGDTGDGPDAPPPIVTNMPAAEGRALLERDGLEFGAVRQVKSRAPHYWILEQSKAGSPTDGTTSRIDLVVADSDFELEAHHSLIHADGDDIEAEIVYEPGLSRDSNDRTRSPASSRSE